jgi:hypothetical protein
VWTPFATNPTVVVELDHTVPLRVDAVAEDGGACAAMADAAKRLRQAVAVHDVVAQNETRRTSAHEIGPDGEA